MLLISFLLTVPVLFIQWLIGRLWLTRKKKQAIIIKMNPHETNNNVTTIGF